MKVGSLVEHVRAAKHPMIGITQLIVGDIYTVREIQNFPSGTAICLEEVINTRHPLYDFEIGYNICRFREIQPPMEIKIEDFITELQPA